MLDTEHASANQTSVISEWLDRLEKLVVDVKTWAEASGWKTRRVQKTVDEAPRLGSYKAPVLLMEKETVQVVLNPVGRYIPGAEGAVDLYLAPAYDDIASLYLEGGQWFVHYVPATEPAAVARPSEAAREPLSEELICRLIEAMGNHA